jgi:hypothetical protein
MRHVNEWNVWTLTENAYINQHSTINILLPIYNFNSYCRLPLINNQLCVI